MKKIYLIVLFSLLVACTNKPATDNVSAAAANSPKYYQTSFDCNGGLVPAEQIICKNEIIADYDLKLSALYKDSLKKYENDPGTTNNIKQAQRFWLKNMRKMTDEKEIADAYLERLVELSYRVLYVLSDYSWSHRVGSGTNGVGESFTAHSKGGKILVLYKDECQKLFDEVVKSDFQDSDDCSDWQSTCYKIKGNEVDGSGYVESSDVFRCIPLGMWLYLKPLADDKCYGPYDQDGWRDTTPCDDWWREQDRYMIKSPDAVKDVVKKHPDCNSDGLFPCEK